jgi:hypothetical protein
LFPSGSCSKTSPSGWRLRTRRTLTRYPAAFTAATAAFRESPRTSGTRPDAVRLGSLVVGAAGGCARRVVVLRVVVRRVVVCRVVVLGLVVVALGVVVVVVVVAARVVVVAARVVVR